jgi:hypothetical protein
MNHDPLCQASDDDDIYFCVCEFIAKVRADERERIVHNVTAEWAETVRDYRADLRAKVEALPGAPASGSGWIARDDVLALFGSGDDLG